MDREMWIITPISGTLIGIVIVLPIFTAILAADATFNFIYRNSNIFFAAFLIISVILMLIPLIGGVHLASILAIPAGVIVASQMLYMFNNGLHAIANMGNAGFAILGRTMTFLVWFLYMLLNLIVTFGSMGIGAWFSFGYKAEKKSSANTSDLYFSLGMTAGLSTALGVIGWIIIWFFL